MAFTNGEPKEKKNFATQVKAPFKARALFKKMRKTDNAQAKLHNLPKKSGNVLPLSKKARVGKGTEEKEEDDVVSLRGHLEKAKEALAKAQEVMGVAKKAMAQVNTPHPIPRKGIHAPMTHTAGRIPQRIFT